MESWVHRSYRATVGHIAKHKLTIQSIKVKPIDVYGVGNQTLLIINCNTQEIYYYAPAMTRTEVHQLRRKLMREEGQPYFPLYFEE